MNIEINKFQIIQFIKMCSNNFKPTEFLTDVRKKETKKTKQKKNKKKNTHKKLCVKEQRIIIVMWMDHSEKH